MGRKQVFIRESQSSDNPFSKVFKTLAENVQYNPFLSVFISLLPAAMLGLAIFIFFLTPHLDIKDQALANLIFLTSVVFFVLILARSLLRSFLISAASKQHKTLKYKQLQTEPTIRQRQQAYLLMTFSAIVMLGFNFLMRQLAVEIGSKKLYYLLALAGCLLVLHFVVWTLICIDFVLAKNDSLLAAYKKASGKIAGNPLNLTAACIAALVVGGAFWMPTLSGVVADNSLSSIKKRHPQLWISLALVSFVAATLTAFYGNYYNRLRDTSLQPASSQTDAENFCYYDSILKRYSCSVNRSECMSNTDCKNTLEARDEINDILNNPL